MEVGEDANYLWKEGFLWIIKFIPGYFPLFIFVFVFLGINSSKVLVLELQKCKTHRPNWIFSNTPTNLATSFPFDQLIKRLSETMNWFHEKEKKKKKRRRENIMNALITWIKSLFNYALSLTFFYRSINQIQNSYQSNL